MLNKWKDLLEKLTITENLEETEIAEILDARDPELEKKLFQLADQKRKEYVGDEVHLRGLIEFSNFCRKNCLYCGLRKDNKNLKRFRMPPQEILAVAEKAHRLGIQTIVLQSGEDLYYDAKTLAKLIWKIKKLGVAVTLSVGEREEEEYALWKEAGADRFLLKQETFDRELFSKLHPDDDFDQRLHSQQKLMEIGFQTGSGNIVGLPWQTTRHLAHDIKMFQKMDFDMIGIGPFIPHPSTPLGKYSMNAQLKLSLTLKTVALTRILTKNAHIPATTALGTLVAGGRELALRCGANVLMPNLTPLAYRSSYEIYPGKICIQENWGACIPCMKKMVEKLGRKVATDPGHSLKNRSRVYSQTSGSVFSKS